MPWENDDLLDPHNFVRVGVKRLGGMGPLNELYDKTLLGKGYYTTQGRDEEVQRLKLGAQGYIRYGAVEQVTAHIPRSNVITIETK